ETLAEVTLAVDNWRWAGVPFVLRSGKALGEARQDIRIIFKPVPHLPTGLTGVAEPSSLRVSMKPATLDLDLVINGQGDPFTLEQVPLHSDLGAGELSAYGEVLDELLDGETTLSVRGDVAEQCWRIITPILEAWRADKVPLDSYPAGTAGPIDWS
ncbi:MAG: glucose-6-phosphate dehydrogenase, partial [Rhodoglobus sp.]